MGFLMENNSKIKVSSYFESWVKSTSWLQCFYNEKEEKVIGVFRFW
jgi:hypothetical protein